MKSEDHSTVTFRLPSTLVDELRKRAVEEDRSLNNMVKILLSEVVKK